MRLFTNLRTKGRAAALAAITTTALLALSGGAVAHANPAPPPPTPAKPDLLISATGFQQFGYDTYLVFSVKNAGQANAGAFRIGVHDGSGPLVQVIAVGNGLAAGHSQTYFHKLPPFSCGGTHTRKVTADFTGLVAESNEANNSVTKVHIYPVC